jgi:hypothetical protein
MNVHASIRRWSLGAILASVFTPLLAMASTDNGSLTAGSAATGTCGGVHVITSRGYSSGAFGTYSPTGLTGGETVVSVFDHGPTPPCVPAVAVLSVSGFSSDPGSSWLTSITCNGVDNSTVSTYSYSAGEATWTFTKQFGFASGSNYSCSIVHT